MVQYIGHDQCGCHVYAVRFSPGCLEAAPWGAEKFECTIFACDPREVREQGHEIAAAVVDANTDWINTTGPEAERLHDLIDAAAVERGRQAAVGDGSPMTAWHEEALGLDQMAELACLSMGGQDYVVALVVGDESDFADSVAALRSCLRKLPH